MQQAYMSHASNLITPNPADCHSSASQKKFWSFTKNLRKDTCGTPAVKVNNACDSHRQFGQSRGSYFKSVFILMNLMLHCLANKGLKYTGY